MATVLLAVSSDYSASGVVAQGSIDAGFQYNLGAAVPCPGVFPCSIKAKLKINGNSSGVVDAVYAGPNHAIIRESLHNYIASSGSAVRLETINRSVKIAGGTYVEPLNTLNPTSAPYAGLPSISLNGLPLEFSAGTFTGSTVIGGSPTNPADNANYYFSSDPYTYTFSDKSFIGEGVNILFLNQLGIGSRPISINMDAYGGYALASGSLQASTPIQLVKAPSLAGSTDLDDGNIYYGSGGNTYISRRPVSTLLASDNAPVFGCFNSVTGQQNPSVFGTQPGSYLESLAVYGIENNYGKYVFAGIRKADSTAYVGQFSAASTAASSLNPEFFQFYKAYTNSSGLKPSFGFDTAFRSVDTNTGKVNSFWASAYPQGRRYSAYLDVKATQYGFVFLNKDTQHLEFLFQPHMEPWMISSKLQAINKIVHAPPRSADYYPALNMLLGVDPRDPINGASLYLQNDATIRGYFTADQITHGGGGHVMALGTFNGAIVNNGKVTVWGSNRWGQCIIPAAISAYVAYGKIVDVAVSNAPPVLKTDSQQYQNNTVYSDDIGEFYARYSYDPADNSYDVATGTRSKYYSFPPRPTERYGQHINYSNLPGHVVVVTQEGWVYAWGNDKYYQCQVPDEISLVDSGGAVKAGAPADPISEVSAGAFHTVARSRAGIVYVWGAGGPWAGIDGRVTGASQNDLVPADGGNPAVYTAVHFGQSCLSTTSATTNYLGVNVPQNDPLTGSGTTTEAVSYVVTPQTTTSLVKTVGGSQVTIGQKTSTVFSVADPGTPAGSSGRLKGMIGAGAFHTAIIDTGLKIQCIGAGRGYGSATTTDISTSTPEKISLGAAIWGSSYSYPDTKFSTYPHYCQSLDQYRCPAPIVASTNYGVGLFRKQSDTSLAHKSRYFQNLQFKKVVCGPFTTHGIIYSVGRANTLANPYTAIDKAYLHNRVVSWGCAFTLRGERANQQFTGPTGIRHTFLSNASQLGTITNYTNTYNATPSYNISGTLAGVGALNTSYTPRYFEILNRPVTATLSGMYTATTSLVASSPTTDSATGTSVGTVLSTDTASTAPFFNTHCPVTISRFKVKDLASCGDYTVFIGYLDKLSCSSLKWYSGDTSTAAARSSNATFDYQSSVFFTGTDYYTGAQAVTPDSCPGRLHATNPYMGMNLVRRNKIGAPYYNTDSTGVPVKDRSLYFGYVKQSATGVQGALPGGSAQTLQYVIPTTALASNNMVAAIVNMDNRPVAWSGFFQMSANGYEAPLDLSLLPSVPIQNFKTGKAHIMAITAGDWPIATSLASINNTPKIVSELSTRLFSGTVPTVYVAPNLIYGDANAYSRPALIAWGAGDGREYGSTLLSFSSGSGMGSTFGLQFMDTHALTRYDSSYTLIPTVGQTLSSTAGTDDWENYYGHYRLNVYSTYSGAYVDPYLEVSGGGGGIGSLGGPQQPTENAITLPQGHHAVEAMQSMLAFRQDKYPSSFANPALTGRNNLNGSSVAAIPAAAYVPFLQYASYPTGTDLKKVVCCTTAADEAGANYTSINSLQEFHSALGYMQQTYTDYVTDYAAGSKHSAVLFNSACPDYTKIADGTYRTSLANFNNYFMSDATGAIPFGSRRVRKLGIVGYGCENQTAGMERALADGSLAPIVPMLFGTNARVYCGDSYTLVTNPIKIHTVSSTATALNLTAGASASTLTIPITVPSSLFSRRIRGLDVLLTFTATSASNPLPLTNLTISIPYKGNTWTVLDQLRANLDTTAATAYVAGGTATTTYRISDRLWWTPYAYTNPTSGEYYSELGLDPSVSASYTTDGTKYYLKGIDSGAAIPALSRQGVYGATSVGSSGTAASHPTWVFSTNGNVVFPFNEPTINVLISDATNATSYSGYTLTVKLEIEVDAGDVPYVVFGPKRSGVYNEIEGAGPSYVADIGNFGSDGSRPNVDILSCPCEVDSSLQDRQYPKSFPADSRFLCGTKKYGPSGNRENQAAYATTTYYYAGGTSRPPLLGGTEITANFFSLFDTVPHRPAYKLVDDINSQAPVLQVLPSAAFVSSGVTKYLTGGTAFQLDLPKLYMGIKIEFGSSVVQPISTGLAVSKPYMYNNYQSAVNAATSVTVSSVGFVLNIGMQSGIC